MFHMEYQYRNNHEKAYLSILFYYLLFYECIDLGVILLEGKHSTSFAPSIKR